MAQHVSSSAIESWPCYEGVGWNPTAKTNVFCHVFLCHFCGSVAKLFLYLSEAADDIYNFDLKLMDVQVNKSSLICIRWERLRKSLEGVPRLEDDKWSFYLLLWFAAVRYVSQIIFPDQCKTIWYTCIWNCRISQSTCGGDVSYYVVCFLSTTSHTTAR